jgi:cold-inducible RNA-binding protein
MGKRLYVGNLSYNTTQDELRLEFEKIGAVVDVKVIMDRETGRSRGFAFVEFATEAEANVAVTSFNGQTFAGRSLAVKVAEDRQRTGGGGGGGNRSFNGSGTRSFGGGRDHGPPPQDYGDGGKRNKRGGGGGSRRRGRDEWS